MSEHTNESVSMLNLAQKVHDDYVTEGKTKAENLVSEAQATADSLVSEAQAESTYLRTEAESEANRLVQEAEEKAEDVVKSAEAEAAELERRISGLKKIEYEYRARLSDLANNAIKTLEAATEGAYDAEESIVQL